MLVCDPCLHTSFNEISSNCQLGLGVRSVGSVSVMVGKWYGTVGCRECWGRCTVKSGG
nr:hypothetical protein [Tanacetum cinerariifolium]